jgi:hypothetical protein
MNIDYRKVLLMGRSGTRTPPLRGIQLMRCREWKDVNAFGDLVSFPELCNPKCLMKLTPSARVIVLVIQNDWALPLMSSNLLFAFWVL